MFPRQERRLDLSIPSNIGFPYTISHSSPFRYRALRAAIDGLLTSNPHVCYLTHPRQQKKMPPRVKKRTDNGDVVLQLNRWVLHASWTPLHPPISVIGSAGETGDLECTPPCHTPAIPCIQHDAYSVSVHVRVGADPA